MSASSQPVVTDDDFSSIPSTISWFLGVTSVLFVTAKILTKQMFTTGNFGIDDAAIMAALAFSIGMVAAVSVQGANGLGRRESSLAEPQLKRLEKSVYVTDFLYITTLFFSKCSILALLKALTPVRRYRLLTNALAGVVGSWAVSGLFTVAFQCSTPQKWATVTGSCIDQTSFWISFGIFNMIFEALLVAIPIVMMRSVQIHQGTKTAITLIFALRIFVMAAIVAELIFLRRAGQSTDRTFARWPVVVCALFVQCLSIVFACVPYLKPFFGALESGMIRVDDMRRRKGHANATRLKTAKDSSSQGIGGRILSLKNWTHSIGGTHIALAERSPDQDADCYSQRSDSRIIRATTTIEVVGG